MIKVLAAMIVVCANLSAQQESKASPPADPWQSLRFLLGTWEARTQGGSAEASGVGAYAFQLEFRDHVLSRHSNTVTCEGSTPFNCQHIDLLYVYPDARAQTLKAIYFDNEGHVIRYDVTTANPGTAIFLSPASEPGPQFRLSYHLNGQVMEGKFEVRMPSERDFRPYLEWSGQKR